MRLTKIKKCIMFIVILSLFSLTACSNNPSSDNSRDSSINVQSQSQDADSSTVTDREGNTIILPKKVDKIISMAPSITETLVHLGLGDKLIAVDKYSISISGLPENLPAFDIMVPDTESIAAMKPDIIFVTGMSKANGDDPYQPVIDLGVTVTYIPSSTSLENIKEDIKFIGLVTNTSSNAESIVANMEKEITDITAKIAGAKSGKTVYFEIEATPNIYSFGKETFLNEMIEALGAKNILADQNSWVSVSEEVVINKNPDVIFTNVDYVNNPMGDILNRDGWNAVNAVKNKQVYQVDRNASSHPNEYVTAALLQMAEALYPDLFK